MSKIGKKNIVLPNDTSIKIDGDKITNSSSINLDKKNIFLSNKGDIVSIGKLDGNLFKPNKILI